jgi:pyridoxamine 5'-phosphate oxidase
MNIPGNAAGAAHAAGRDGRQRQDVAAARREYRLGQLTETAVDRDPMVQFGRWFQEASATNAMARWGEPNAMTLATVAPDGRPSARIVLLKGFDQRGFAFYTNYDSRKGQALRACPHAALVLWWPQLERQARIEGAVERVSEQESDTYFQTRPIGSRLAAWASAQSTVIAGREVLEERLEQVSARYPDGQVPRPPSWGGYRLCPHTIEFWQGRPDRLHDRLRYHRPEVGSAWLLERLAP